MIKISIFLLLICICQITKAESQVDIEIDDPVDLLAVESSFEADQIRFNEIRDQPITRGAVRIQDAPANFGGQRLVFNNNNEDGGYMFEYSEAGVRREESGFGDGSKTGSYEYVAPDGQVISLSFVADLNGFVARGQHLPQPPPLPPALQRFEDAKNGRFTYHRN